jgi:hypothetical protein
MILCCLQSNGAMVIVTGSALSTRKLLAKQIPDKTLEMKYPVVRDSFDMNGSKFGPRSIFLDHSQVAVLERVMKTCNLTEAEATKMLPAIRWATDTNPRLLAKRARAMHQWIKDFQAHKANLSFARPLTPGEHDAKRSVLRYALEQTLVSVNAEVLSQNTTPCVLSTDGLLIVLYRR